MKLYQLITGAICLALLSACAPQQKTVTQFQEVGQAQFTYQATGNRGLEGLSIGILNAKFLTSSKNQEFAQNAAMMYAMQGRNADTSGLGFTSDISNRMANAYYRDVESILTRKSAGVRGPFRNYEEMPYGDKDKITLIIEPQINVGLRNIPTSQQSGSFGTTNILTGKFAAIAEGTLRFKEPLTNELIFVKRINVTVESEPYTYAYKVKSNDDMITGLMKNAMTSKFESKDNRKLRQSQVLTSLYRQMMSAIDVSISPGEIHQHLAEISRLKGRKQF